MRRGVAVWLEEETVDVDGASEDAVVTAALSLLVHMVTCLAKFIL